MKQLRRRTAVIGPIRDEILRAAKILFEPGDVTELRILGPGSKVISGYRLPFSRRLGRKLVFSAREIGRFIKASR